MAVSQERQLTELKPQRSGNAGILANAIRGRLIAKCGAENLKEVLRLCMVKVGLRANNWPQNEEKAVLIAHIVENYGGHTAEEVKLAFDMAISGNLDIDDVNCYENFSCAYFSKIMNAYRRWAAQEVKTIRPDSLPEQKIFTPEELDNSAREDAERQYQSFLRGYEIKNTHINKAILDKDGFLKDGEDVMQFFKRAVGLGYRNIYIQSV